MTVPVAVSLKAPGPNGPWLVIGVVVAKLVLPGSAHVW